jgi:hypothetical protein
VNWHHAFVFNEESCIMDIYEVFLGDGQYSRTVNPVYSLFSEDCDDAISRIELILKDLKKGKTSFKTIEEMDEFYKIKD